MTGASSIQDAVHRYYALVDANRFDELVELFTTDATYERPGYRPLVGRGELTAFYRGERVIADGRHVVDQLLTSGQDAVVRGSFAGTLKGGDAVSLRFADFFRTDGNGLFAHRVTYFFAPLV
ncbi:nuclear transport factor 2 family protein [Kitasatospora putterlickiae]|uniref:Nuclear transport factor 2 family protein n=1 Tax=Kitasatospora putterlickiae TaxID=221725 RepID=A0ABN1XYE5_9ACTN